MGNRLSKIYTRTGDGGTTGLGDGSRVEKTSTRVEAMGAIDELNSIIGLLMTESLSDDVTGILEEIQHSLFDLGGELSLPGQTLLGEERVTQIEHTLDRLNAPLPPLKEFILPGGSRAAAVCHQARSVCRRAERRLLALKDSHKGPPASIKYINRLSDLLFVMARNLNQEAKEPDILWQRSPNNS